MQHVCLIIRIFPLRSNIVYALITWYLMLLRDNFSSQKCTPLFHYVFGIIYIATIPSQEFFCYEMLREIVKVWKSKLDYNFERHIKFDKYKRMKMKFLQNIHYIHYYKSFPPKISTSSNYCLNLVILANFYCHNIVFKL